MGDKNIWNCRSALIFTFLIVLDKYDQVFKTITDIAYFNLIYTKHAPMKTLAILIGGNFLFR